MVRVEQKLESDRPINDTWALIMDLERLVPCVQGGRVLEKTGETQVKAEIRVKMGALSVKYRGTVDIIEADPVAYRALLRVKSREAAGSGQANADVIFRLFNGGGDIHTEAQISGKAASRGEGMIQTVLEAMIKDFSEKFVAIA